MYRNDTIETIICLKLIVNHFSYRSSFLRESLFGEWEEMHRESENDSSQENVGSILPTVVSLQRKLPGLYTAGKYISSIVTILRF